MEWTQPANHKLWIKPRRGPVATLTTLAAMSQRWSGRKPSPLLRVSVLAVQHHSPDSAASPSTPTFPLLVARYGRVHSSIGPHTSPADTSITVN
jgi:hypothetical protein